MSKNKKLWIGVISLVMAFLLFAVLLMVQQSMKEEPVYEEVMCAKTMVSKNIRITEQNIERYLEQRAVPVTWLPKDYISEPESVYGMVLEADLTEGSILTKTVLTAHHEYYNEYQNLTWISVPIDELYKGVAGRLRVGDYIDIYMLCEAEQGYRCSLVAEKVRVEAAYSDRGTEIGEDNQEGLSQLIVIPMEKEQVAVFYETLAQGNIRIAKYEAL